MTGRGSVAGHRSMLAQNMLVFVLALISIGFSIFLMRQQDSIQEVRLPKRTGIVAPTVRLHLSTPSPVVRRSDPAKLTLTITNEGREELYATTNMDPYVSGSGLLRNYYYTMSGDCVPAMIQRATLNFGAGVFGEQSLLSIRAIVLLKRGQSYSADLPVATWGTLATQPGKCWIQVHYRGEGAAGPFSRPFVSRTLHSNHVEVMFR